MLYKGLEHLRIWVFERDPGTNSPWIQRNDCNSNTRTAIQPYLWGHGQVLYHLREKLLKMLLLLKTQQGILKVCDPFAVFPRPLVFSLKARQPPCSLKFQATEPASPAWSCPPQGACLAVLHRDLQVFNVRNSLGDFEWYVSQMITSVN